jgi:hypothetical protein
MRIRTRNGRFAHNGCSLDHKDRDGEAMAECNCARPEEFGDSRHRFDCPCAADVQGWLFYRHDGELEAGPGCCAGGVFVNPRDRRQIVLLVKDALIPVGRSEHPIVHGAGEDFRNPPTMEQFVRF